MRFSINKYKQQSAHIRLQVKFWQNIFEELLKIEYLINLSQYFKNFTQ